MFRKMRRFKQELPERECIEVLEREPRGVLAVYGEGGYPYAFPLNYIFMDDKLYFHCAKEGHKIDALAANDKVSFCVMDEGYRNDGDWALNIRSVIVFGRVKKIDDCDEAVRIVRRIGQKYYPAPEDVDKEVQSSAARVQILELTIDHMTGKLVNEK